MAEKIRPELLSFLQPNAALLRVLVVEGLSYLPELRRMFPRAELYAVTADMDAMEMDVPAGVHWQILDYLSVPLPYTRGYFDYIISDLTLEKADNPQDIAAGFSMFLKETGAFLTSFRNIRHWSVLKNLMEGHYYNIVSRLYTRAEFENLLYASFYKSIRVQQQKREAPTGLIECLVTAGFENELDDLETEFYFVRADRSMPELSLLKSMYTKSAREQMVRLIHRIEYDVEREASVQSLWVLLDRLSVFPAYAASLIRETVVHTEAFYRRLSMDYDGRDAFIYEMLGVSAMECVDPVDRELYYSLQREFAHEKNREIMDVDQNKVAFISCVNDEDMYSECLLYLKSLYIPDGMSIEYIPVRNAASMCAGYNEGARASDAKYKIYLHQDVLVVNKNIIVDLLSIFEDPTIGLVGMIGCRSLPRSGVWWDGLRTYGRVLHHCEPESVVDSHCMEPEGAYIDVEAVDGLFLATQYGIRWREDLFTGWHLYDTSMCMEMKRHEFRVVVPNQEEDFWCIHCPREKPLAPEYKRYQKIFLHEYGAELHPEV